MPWRSRCLLATTAVALTIAGAGLGTSPAANATSSPRQRFTITNPCTYLSTRQVQTAFGGPVTIDPTNRGSHIPATCAYIIGNPLQPRAALVAVNLFPGFFVPAGQTPVDVVETERAVDAQGQLEVLDANVGQDGFFDVNHASLSLVATPKFAFQLQWLPLPFGATLTSPVQKQLTSLAKAITNQARGTH